MVWKRKVFVMEGLHGREFLRRCGRKLSLAPIAAGFCLFLFWAVVTPARAASFTASLDNDTLTLGQSATLSLTFEGGSPQNVPTPSVPGLQISQAGTSQNVSWVNGAMNSTVTVAFSITPQRAGDFIIPAIRIDLNGQPLTSQPLRLRVGQPSAASTEQIDTGSQVAFMKLTLPDSRIYTGEATTANLEIYLRDDVQNYGNIQFPSTPADGFVLGKNASGQRYRKQIGNRVYTVIPISIALTVTKTGNVSLGPFTASMVIVLPSQNQGGDAFFNQFFNPGQQKQITLATDQINVEASPLPAANVPPNFNGAIGVYTMNVTAGPTNVAVGDPVTVRIQISGRGDLASLSLPNQSAWHDFTLYPPTSRLETTDPLGLQGAKTFEQIVAPQTANVRELPPFSFSYFDPDAGDYRTLTEPGVALAVRSVGATPTPTIAANPSAGSQTPARPEDILPIKDHLGALAQASPPLVTRPVFLVLQTVPVLAWLATVVWRKRADSLANNPRLRRHRQVAQLIREGLNDLRQFAAANKPGEFFATLFRLLQEQLGERLDSPASSITEAVIEERLAPLGAPEPLLGHLRELFQLCNQARYAPIRGSAELNSVVRQFENVIGELQGLKA